MNRKKSTFALLFICSLLLASCSNEEQGLTPEQIEALGSADPTDPYIRARLGIPQISEIERPPVVNPLSNQTMAGTDDSGDSAFTSEFFAASTNETPRLLDALDSTQEP